MEQQPKFNIGDRVRDAYSAAVFEGEITRRTFTISGVYKYWVRNQYGFVQEYDEPWLEKVPRI